MTPEKREGAAHTAGTRKVLSVAEIEARMANIEKIQQLGGHFPDGDALGRARRILTGEISRDDARAEIDAKYSK